MDKKIKGVENLTKYIHGIVDIMRGHFPLEVAATLILPQMFAHRLIMLAEEDKLPSPLFNKFNLKSTSLHSIQDLCNLLNKLDQIDSKITNGVFNKFTFEYESIKDEEIAVLIFNKVANIDYSTKSMTIDEFGELFLDLQKTFFNTGYERGKNLSAKITEEAFSGIKLSPGTHFILDPAFGIGATSIKFVKSQREGVFVYVCGYESNNDTYSFAIMNLISNGIYSFNLKNEDALEADWKRQYKYSLILVDPPLGPNKKSGEYFESLFIEKAFDHLSDIGIVLILASMGTLFTGSETGRKRKQWINQNYLRKVISIPEKFGRYNTNIPVCYMMFEKNRSNEFVEFIDFTQTEQSKLEELIEQAKSFFTLKIIDQSITKSVNHEDIRKQNYNLIPARYVGEIHDKVKELKQSGEGVPLKNILEVRSGVTFNEAEFENNSNKYIKISDLKNDPFDYEIDSDKLSTLYDNLDVKRVQKIEESCLLIARSWKSLKPTFLKIKDTPVFIDRSIISFKVSEDKVSLDYLMYQLHSEMFTKQDRSILQGATVPYRLALDFLNLVIEIPSMNILEQDQLLNESKVKVLEKAYKEKKTEADKILQELKSKREAEADFRDSEEEEIIHFINHNVRNKLSPVKESVETLYRFLNKEAQTSLSLITRIGKPLEGESIDDLPTAGDLFRYARFGINNAINSLMRLETYRFNEYKTSDFERIDFMKWLEEDLGNKNLEYQYLVTTKEANQDDLFITEIVPGAITDIIDNLLVNAESHGFSKDKSKYNVWFELSVDDKYIIIDYKNDGEPLPNSINQNTFGNWGSKSGKNSGAGWGGFFITRTIKKHKGLFEIISSDTKSLTYNIHFRIKLPRVTNGN